MNSDITDFICPVLKGRRFDNHGLPLDILKDFQVFDIMVKSVAKTLFKQDNPNRRFPRSFLEGISLQLTGLENGSAIPRISLVVNPAAMMRADNISLSRKYAEKAREEIVQTITRQESLQVLLFQRG